LSVSVLSQLESLRRSFFLTAALGTNADLSFSSGHRFL
jgi:hypothetical protein